MDSMRYLNAKFEIFPRCQIINQLRSCYLVLDQWRVDVRTFSLGVSMTLPLAFCTSIVIGLR